MNLDVVASSIPLDSGPPGPGWRTRPVSRGPFRGSMWVADREKTRTDHRNEHRAVPAPRRSDDCSPSVQPDQELTNRGRVRIQFRGAFGRALCRGPVASILVKPGESEPRRCIPGG